jgi:hypothetical protein
VADTHLKGNLSPPDYFYPKITHKGSSTREVLMHLRAGGLGLVAVYLLLPASLPAQSPGEPPPAGEIVKKVIARARRAEADNPAARYTYRQVSLTEELDTNGGVRERQERIFQVVPVEGEPYPRLARIDGRPLSEKEKREELKRERKFRRERSDRRRKKETDPERVRVDEELFNRFRFQVLGRERVNGRTAYLLSFEPKSHNLPVRRRMDRFINKFAGKLWVDEQDYEVSRVEGHLTEPVTIGWTILGNLQEMNFVFERTRFEEAWLPARLTAYLNGRKFFTPLRRRLNNRWQDFERASPEIVERQSASE